MPIATTSLSDGIAIVAFATVLFLIPFGLAVVIRGPFIGFTGKTEPAGETMMMPRAVIPESLLKLSGGGNEIRGCNPAPDSGMARVVPSLGLEMDA
jgi:hypothetical protein